MAYPIKQRYHTGAAIVAIDDDVDPGGEILKHVAVHLSAAAAAENLVISIVLPQGSDYTLTLKTQAMAGLTDYVYYPDADHYIPFGGSIKVDHANSNLRTYGIVITTLG
jgi:hypothetical protein